MASSDKSFRQKCLEYKKQKCAVCGDSDEIEVHHIDGDRSNNSISNLEPLCASCHADVHNGGIEGYDYAEKLQTPNKELMTSVSTRLNNSTIEYLKDVAEEENKTRSRVIREHIEFTKERKTGELADVERLKIERDNLQQRLDRSQELVDSLIGSRE